MEFSAIKQTLEQKTGLLIKENELLKNHTSFGIGGPASLYAKLHSPEDTHNILVAARALELPTVILGGGTNVLVSDDGIEGLVIATAFHRMEQTDAATITVGASVPSADFVEYTVSRGLKGFAFAAGLPGSIGGALAGNAGCFGSTFSEHLVCAKVVDENGAIEIVRDPNWFQFAYRHSSVQQRKALIAEITFAVSKGDKDELRQIADGHILTRMTKHPSKGVKTAGSYFKNLPPQKPGEWRRPAGALLDQVGAKEMQVGDAAVFEKHANILINKGNATARDVLELERMLTEKVRDQFGVTLEPEVRFVGKRPQ